MLVAKPLEARAVQDSVLHGATCRPADERRRDGGQRLFAAIVVQTKKALVVLSEPGIPTSGLGPLAPGQGRYLRTTVFRLPVVGLALAVKH